MTSELEPEEEIHPFRKRSKAIRDTLFLLTAQGPVSWDAIFIAARTIDVAENTMRNAVNEGVNLGVFIKTGGRSGKKYGHPTGPAMVELTPGGRRWYEVQEEAELFKATEAEAAAAGAYITPDDEVSFCKHDDFLALCDECSNIPTPTDAGDQPDTND